MASSIALKRMVSALRSATHTPVASSRLFNTNAFVPLTDVVFSLFSSIFPRNTSQILNLMDRFSETGPPFVDVIRYVAEETVEGVHINVDLPGLRKEDVKLSVEQNTLVIKGESKAVTGEGEDPRREVSTRIELPDERRYKIDAIKAVMKNGVLKMFVPKVKEEERTDVFQVKVV